MRKFQTKFVKKKSKHTFYDQNFFPPKIMLFMW